jgi:hypothetical protein
MAPICRILPPDDAILLTNVVSAPICGSHTAHVAPIWCNPLNTAPMACTLHKAPTWGPLHLIVHAWLPYGPHMVHVAPIWCIRLPCGAWEPHMAPFSSQMVPFGSCTVHMAPIWPPLGARCPHVVSSTSHTCKWLQYGSQMAHVTPIQLILAPIWPLHGAWGSHMALSALHMAHMAPMWCMQLQFWHNLPPIWCRQLPFGACGSHIVYAAPVWYQMVQSGSHLAPIWLPSGTHGSCMVHMAPILPPYSACGFSMVPSVTRMAYVAPIWLRSDTWLPVKGGT